MDTACPYVSRGGLKLAHALEQFGFDVTGMACADFGCSTGGFTDCLLQHGAATVVSIDTAYGELAWKLRNDPRVRVTERTNAMHAAPPPENGRVDLVVADLGWTKQKHLIPAALKWLKPQGRILTLIKPHYEQESATHGRVVLNNADAKAITDRVVLEIEQLGTKVLQLVESPILGGAKSGTKSKGSGNPEWLALIAPKPASSSPQSHPPD